MKKGQGAIEYLLVLGAVIIVTIIVVNFMTGAITPTKQSGNLQKWTYLCETLDSNTEDCWCYNNNTTYTDSTTCCAKDDLYLNEGWGC